MALFSYTARDNTGRLRSGVLEGGDIGSVAEQLFGRGMTPLTIAATSKSRDTASDGIGIGRRLRKFFAPKITSLDVQMFSRQLYTLLKAGVPITRGLAGLQQSATNPSFALVLQDLRDSLDGGRELSAALRRHPTIFNPYYLSMVAIGGMTGRLDEVLLRLFDHLEFDREMRMRVKSALRYPIFVMIAMAAALAIINVFVLPQFEKVFISFNAELPLMTRILLGVSGFTLTYWPVVLGFIVAVIVGVKLYLKQPLGRMQWDRHKMRLPIAGSIMQKATLARFARSFALSIKSGIPIVSALSVVVQTVDNTYLAARIDMMRASIERGDTISRTAIATGVFTPIVLQMISVGEETGSLDDLMDEVARMYEREVDYELTTLSAQIEPILITFLGIMVLILALGVFLPVWDLGRAALHK
jgi:MSHA biogenesis protein MshG